MPQFHQDPGMGGGTYREAVNRGRYVVNHIVSGGNKKPFTGKTSFDDCRTRTTLGDPIACTNACSVS